MTLFNLNYLLKAHLLIYHTEIRTSTHELGGTQSREDGNDTMAVHCIPRGPLLGYALDAEHPNYWNGKMLDP